MHQVSRFEAERACPISINEPPPRWPQSVTRARYERKDSSMCRVAKVSRAHGSPADRLRQAPRSGCEGFGSGWVERIAGYSGKVEVEEDWAAEVGLRREAATACIFLHQVGPGVAPPWQGDRTGPPLRSEVARGGGLQDRAVLLAGGRGGDDAGGSLPLRVRDGGGSSCRRSSRLSGDVERSAA